MEKKEDRTAVLPRFLRWDAGRSSTDSSRRVMVYAVCCLLVIVSILVNSGSAFEYTTEKPARGYVYVPGSGETISQQIPDGKKVLKGIRIRFVPMEEITSGEVEVRLYRNDAEVQTWRMLSSELSEDQYRLFRLERALNIDEEDHCSFTVSETYETDWSSGGRTGIAMGGSAVIEEDGDSDTVDGIIWGEGSGYEGPKDAEAEPDVRSVCFQLTMEDPSIRFATLLPFIFALVILCAAGGILIDFNRIRMRKMIMITFCLVIFVGTAATGLMQNVVRDVTVRGFQDEDVTVKLEPGETLEKSFYADLCDFSAVEFSVSVSENRSEQMHVTLRKADQEDAYYDGDISGRDMLSGGPGDRRVRISASDTDAGDMFPMGLYEISITNTDENRKLRISMVEQGLTERPAVMEGQSEEDSVEEDIYHSSYESDSQGGEYVTEEPAQKISVLNYALIRTSSLGYRIACAVFVILAAYLLLFAAMISRGRISAGRFFVVSAVPLGIVYLILMLPWSPPDTGSHILASYRLSNMILGADRDSQWKVRAEDAAWFPAEWQEGAVETPHFPCMEEYARTFLRSGDPVSAEAGSKDENADTGRTDSGADVFPAGIPEPDENGMVEYFADVKMEYYSMLNYLPQVLGFTTGRFLGMGPVSALYLGRILILVVYIMACVHAIRITPVGKSVFAGIGLLPMCLMFSSSYSYDAMVIISAIGFTAAVLAAYHAPDNRRRWFECAFWAFLIGSVKGGGYLILLPLVLLLHSLRNQGSHDDPVEVRSQRFEQYKNALRIMLITFAAGLVSILLFDLILPSGSLFQFGESGTGKLTFSFALLHPIRYLQMLLGAYISFADSLFLNVGGTRLTWIENTIPNTLIAGLLGVIAVWAVFEKDSLHFQRRDRKVFQFIVALEMLLTPAMLLSWTPMDSNVIRGLQGRYFLPVLPLVYFIFTKFLPGRNAEGTEKGEAVIRRTCMQWFCWISCLCVYSMLCLYLTR